ncbi:MAG: hypothetical protein U0470_10140 [Anaerolineae bacterium]
MISAGLAPTINSNVDNQFVATLNDVLLACAAWLAAGGVHEREFRQRVADAIGVHALAAAAPDTCSTTVATAGLGRRPDVHVCRIEILARGESRGASLAITEFGWTTDSSPRLHLQLDGRRPRDPR